ncbi:hypothetical protein L1049_002699 [Liquidambar formosana]|uniref:TPX2 C-terminal domain-containing protein n=1 Tax=Liquidambar formosana TaxID=63359 RepID=A0AAP0NG58_LIQFO
MDSMGKSGGAVTPVKNPQASRSKNAEKSNFSENYNPNVSTSSPVIKSAKKSASKNPNPIVSPRNRMRERRFVVAKKNSKKEKTASKVICKCKEKNGGKDFHKCLCVAYESLKASQEDFFKNRGSGVEDQDCERADYKGEEGEEKNSMMENSEFGDEYEEKVDEDSFLAMNESDNHDPDAIEGMTEMGSSTIKRRREKFLEEARKSVPEPGSGRVMHLVKAFEKFLSIPSSKESDEKEDKEAEESDNKKKVMKWALPGLQQPKVAETRESLSSFCPSDLFLTSENLGLDSRGVSSSWDSSQGSFSISSRTSGGGHRSRRNSSESCGTIGGSKWKKKQLKATSQKPFKLRTEQRGRLKEEELMKKIQKMMEEEERQRIPIAQGLPWTTDEPECLVKPPVKEYTKPVDLKLHSDVRAEERAEFDHQVAEKLSLIEQYKMERERQQKLEEEEEIRRLRKDLVPKAQPMPYFDRPFIPRRSMKHPTVPKEPKFHLPQHKKIKCCLSWNDIGSYTYHQ